MKAVTLAAHQRAWFDAVTESLREEGQSRLLIVPGRKLGATTTAAYLALDHSNVLLVARERHGLRRIDRSGAPGIQFGQMEVPGDGRYSLILVDAELGVARGTTPIRRGSLPWNRGQAYPWLWLEWLVAKWLSPGGTVAVFCPRRGEVDLVSELVAGGGWDVTTTPVTTPDGESVWPEVRTKGWLLDMKRMVCADQFRYEMMCGIPTDAELRHLPA